MKMRLFCLSIFLIAILGITGCSSPAEFKGPESVEYDKMKKRYLVSNSKGGEIIAQSESGGLSIFAKGLEVGPFGLEILGTTLYVCSGDSVLGFDLETGNEVFSINLGAGALNGITSDGSSTLFVTDSPGKKIFSVDISKQTFELLTEVDKTPNGIIYDKVGQRLLFVEWVENASIHSLSLVDKTLKTLVSTSLNKIDGLALDKSGNVYVSSWGDNAIYKFGNEFASAPLLISEEVRRPADMYLNQENWQLVVPNSGGSSLTFLDLN